MPNVSITPNVSLPFSEQWRIAEVSPEQTLLEGFDSEDCQLQIRVMKVSPKSPEQRQQLIMSALNTPSPQKVSDTICWSKEEASSDEEDNLQRWLIAISGAGADLSIVILDLSVAKQSELDLVAIEAHVEQALGGIQYQ